MSNQLYTKMDTSKFTIIDAHAHVGKLSTFDIQGGLIDDFIKQMDHIGINQAVISPHLGLKFDAQRSNDYTAECIRKYPSRIIGMATINPNRPEEVIPELERCFDKLNMTIIKLHPEEAKCPMDRSVYQRVYDFAGERGVPILNHDWQSHKRLESLAAKYQNVNFLQAHNGGNWDAHKEDPYFPIVRDMENVFLDTCASPVFYGALEKIVKLIGIDKILFGTDAPFLNFAFGIGKILMADLSHEEKQKLFADNFRTFAKQK